MCLRIDSPGWDISAFLIILCIGSERNMVTLADFSAALQPWKNTSET